VVRRVGTRIRLRLSRVG